MKQVDELIRGEISAVESINAVLAKINDTNERSALNQMSKDHQRAVDSLKRFAEPQLEAKANTSGPWGAFTTAFAGGASFFGDKAALTALKIGEQHGLNEYQEAIRDDSVNQEVRMLIQNELLPVQERHLEMINRYMQ
jgi:hypothetical protein